MTRCNWENSPLFDWEGKRIEPGKTRNVKLSLSESYSGISIRIPIQIRRAQNPGPIIFVTAAIHGDEINGTGAIRELILDEELELTSGAVVFIPVVNILAFDRHSRYLPDRRDLNRSFPGDQTGSLAARLANRIFSQIVNNCDYGIDLHTAALRRTNYPNLRADLHNPEVERMARAFGCEVVVNGRGPLGSFRREACLSGCPTIVMEGGEVWKVEPTIVRTSVDGVKNVLREFDMLEGEPHHQENQLVVNKTKWMRAESGGFLQFHVAPGEVVKENQPLATNANLLGKELNMLRAPFNGVVLGMTTLPAVSPGEPVCHIGQLPAGTMINQVESQRSEADEEMVDNLATNIHIVEPNESEKP